MPVLNSYGRETEPVPTLEEIKRAQEARPSKPRGHGFYTKEGIVYYHGRVFVPPSLANKVIRACHCTPPFNRHGIKMTDGVVKRCFNWPNARKDIWRFIRGC